MLFKPLPLAGAYEIEPKVYEDERGFFYRTYCQEEFANIGHQKPWVQLNHSYTAKRGTLRGMHFQVPPYSEIKLVRCIAGKVWDVIIDVREDSPTFLQWIEVELSAQNKKMIYIPEGFAHGFQTLDDNCELMYHHTAFYTAGFEGGIRYNDPLVDVSWPLQVRSISERDASHPLLTADFKGLKFT